jgi:TolB-like protein/tetratricopeptide (TPR) repeat protein
MEPTGRLNSWKEIAAYLSVSVRTAQRWERTESLPARRHKHTTLSSVFAYRSELDAWWHSRPDLQRLSQPHPEAAPSTAVLPFVNLNRDEENEILSDGLTEELINALTQVEGLHVVARTSAFHFKGKTGDVRTVGARLGVQTILEGSVRRAGDRLRIVAQLVNVADGCHLWSERFDRRMTDWLDVQEEIARAIVGALRVKLAAGRVTRQYSQDLEAYAIYLEGRYHCNRSTRQGFLKAVECFERALARDARMAPAWAGLADCHAFLGWLAGIPAGEALRKAKAAALKALEIDGSLPEPHCSLGFLAAVYEHDWPGAEGHFRRALELHPDHANSHLWYGAHVLAPLARLDEAEIHTRRACELDPLSATMVNSLGALWLMLRQYDRAISACQRALQLDPGHPWAHRWLGEAYLLKGMYSEAASAFARPEAPGIAAGFLGCCYARSGRKPEARRLLRELERASSPWLAEQIAALHLGLGAAEAALDCLLKACRARSPGVHWLKVEPIWDPLRPASGFTAILQEMGLAD